MRQAELYVQADQHFNDYVTQINDQWEKMVPSTPEWSVRQLVTHVTGNNLAVIAKLGSTEPVASSDTETQWIQVAEVAEAAANAQSDPTKMIDTGQSQASIGDFLLMQTADRTLHAWDLAHAIGADENLEPSLVQAVYDIIAPQADAARAAGVFGPEVAVGPDATLQQRLLALTGRDSGYSHDEPTRDPGVERANEVHRSA